jgi:RND family efflux transporter MFP subunit
MGRPGPATTNRRRLFYLFFLILLPPGCGRSTPPPEETAPPATVKWEGPLQSALEEWTELVGTTMPLPDRVARVSTPVDGRVVWVPSGAQNQPIAEGKRVEKGAVLVRLDTTVLQANLAKLKATQDDLQHAVKSAQLAIDLAAIDVTRIKKLKEDEARTGTTGRIPLVSSVEQEKAEVTLKDAQTKYKSAEARLAAGAKEVEAMEKQLELYTLAAPIPGRVGRILVGLGQSLTVGTAITEVVDLDDQIDVLCWVAPSMVGRLKVGMQARTGAADKDATATEVVEADGEIEFIADTAEPETGNFAVKVRFSNKEAHLRANRVLRIAILTKPGRECLSLPVAAVQEDEEKPTVVIVTDVKTVKNADGKEDTVGVARRLEVVLGVRDRKLQQVEIVSLSDPEKDPEKKWHGEVKDALFIVEGAQGLQTGDAVKLEVEGD